MDNSMADQTATPKSLGRGRLLTPGEVAELFRVDRKTASRWAAAGRLASIRTPGGHRRFFEADIRALLREESATVGGGS